MNNKHSYSFLMEYIVVIVIFSICATICISVFTSSYRRNEISNRKKEALETAIAYIESEDYSNDSFTENDIDYSIEKSGNNLLFKASYKDEELLAIEFYGGDYE